MQSIFSFWSFEISDGILRNQKFIIGLDSFSNQRFIYLVLFLYRLSCLKLQKYGIFECFHAAKSEGSLKRLNERKAFFTSSDQSRYTLWSCQNVCDALSYLLDNIYIGFGTKLYRKNVGIPMGTNWASLVADLFLYCYERDADVIEAFSTSMTF